MGLFDDAVPGGNITKPLVIALGALLVGKLISGRGSEPETQTADASPQQPQVEDGGLLGGLGGLLDKLSNAGHGETVDSWVKPGDNKPIEPGQLGSALGSQTISDLARQSGLSEEELLAQLSKVLPGLVDKLTPQGQAPTPGQIATLLRG